MDCIDRFVMKIETENKDDLICNEFNKKTIKVVMAPVREMSEDERYEKAMFDFRMGFIR